MDLELSRKKRLASWLFPRYSSVLDKLNWNAKLVAAVKHSPNVPVFEWREGLHEFVNRRFSDVPIDYLEFGVYRGASLQLWTSTNNHAESRFFGFDSFEGLPEDWNRMPKGTFDTAGRPPEIADHRVQFVAGWFQHTLPQFLAQYQRCARQLIIHNDCDLFSSTLYCLTSLNGIITPGTIVIFDEFEAPLDEFRALTAYSSAYMRKYRIIAATKNLLQAAVEITE
jgi:hypothetical protein